ncbi:DNRLRE domain-containing protein [Paenibacillus sp. YYML68]|uniref:CBM96 family carbohydrate-binding protein n=1 Tax=Paenibacillus sp. YYML68 TaxID=2909250 RepID=UPI0024936B51|nr:DNRLRE domain-containing protein [Paenibacillus sp. YYML68]
MNKKTAAWLTSAVLALSIGAVPAHAGVDPSLPDWSKAGYKGGQSIPTSGTIINLTTKGIAANDGVDDSNALQKVIDDIRSGALKVNGAVVSESNRAILLLPSGQVDLNKQIRVDASYITLRGAGSNPTTGTRIVFKPAATYTVEDGLPVIDGKLWPGYAAFRVEDRTKHANETNYEGSINFHWLSGVKVASGGGGTKGSDKVYLASGNGSKFKAGDTVYVGAANTKELYDQMGAPSSYRENGHMRTQMFKVVSVSGDTLTIDKNLEFDIPYSNGGQIGGSTYYSKVMPVTAVKGVGFESFYFTQDISYTPYASTVNANDYNATSNPNGVGLKYTNALPEYAVHGILFKWAQDGWVKGIRTYMTGSHPIVTEFAKNMDIRDNTIYGAWNKGKGGHGYVRGSKLYDSKIVNNTIDRTRHLTLQWSATGNVVQSNTISVDMNLHGGWERRNLIENNAISVPYEHYSWGEGEGGTESDGTWYPIWWGAGPHASKWSGATGEQNVLFNNTMSKQETKGGAYVTYSPYTSATTIYQLGWDGANWKHLENPAGTLISTWGGNEKVNYSLSPNAGAYHCLSFTGTSLLGNGTATNSCGGSSGGGTPGTPGTPVTLSPSDDSYIRDGSYAGNNYGTTSSMYLKTSSSGNTRHTYLKFDLSNLNSLSSAKLRIYGSASYATTMTAYKTSDSWSEATINWNNKPAAGSNAGSVDMNTTSTYYEIDLTSYASSELSGDQVLSVVLIENSGKYVELNSSENSTNKPQLVILP